MPLAAAMHVRMLADAGCHLDIVGSDVSVLGEDLPVVRRFHIRSSGSGALYAPARVDRRGLARVLADCRPDLVIVEAWQTALTDAAVDSAHALGIPVMMISHGLSVHPFTSSWTDRFRAWAWWPYRRFSLPARVRKLRMLTMLDDQAQSERFHDRDLARHLGVPLQTLVNAPVHLAPALMPREGRQRKILCVGYFSRIKNQLSAIDLLEHLPWDVTLHFIGAKSGPYYAKCTERVRRLGLQGRVVFNDDAECVVADEMAKSMLLLSTSITEALPLVLLEAMASGTPFVATPVGANTSLGCGALANTVQDMALQVSALLENKQHWEQQSGVGLECYRQKYNLVCVRKQLLAAVNAALSGRGGADPVPQEFFVDQTPNQVGQQIDGST